MRATRSWSPVTSFCQVLSEFLGFWLQYNRSTLMKVLFLTPGFVQLFIHSLIYSFSIYLTMSLVLRKPQLQPCWHSMSSRNCKLVALVLTMLPSDTKITYKAFMSSGDMKTSKNNSYKMWLIVTTEAWFQAHRFSLFRNKRSLKLLRLCIWFHWILKGKTILSIIGNGISIQKF